MVGDYIAINAYNTIICYESDRVLDNFSRYCSSISCTSNMVNIVLSIMWWIYVLVMSPMILFSGGFLEFVLGLFLTFILLLIPFIFYKPY